MSSTATAHVAHSEALRGLYKPAIHQCSEQNIIPRFCGPSGSSEKELITKRQFNIKCAPYRTMRTIGEMRLRKSLREAQRAWLKNPFPSLGFCILGDDMRLHRHP
ncbi:hypothetical protein [Gluconacetobacter tumulicola]|uniref:Uncharacterized protein n=1 Tax=Gluconacetobacter tumulicola TaxID=1017177 RepID=A0A7W4JGH5_9PROT|nr:hypothetical protein [Gluconacetobacter tumulicola]MBB2180818.1 hypothetical protein [Gluconacetobacter tumulicola]